MVRVKIYSRMRVSFGYGLQTIIDLDATDTCGCSRCILPEPKLRVTVNTTSDPLATGQFIFLGLT